jgi:hypothetical protein
MCYASHAASTNWPSEPHRDPLTDEETPLPVGIELSPKDIMGGAFKVSGPLPYLSRREITNEAPGVYFVFRPFYEIPTL